MAISASFWFFVQNIDGRKAVYATSILMGSGGSVMLVTSLSLIAQLIGHDKVKKMTFIYSNSFIIQALRAKRQTETELSTL